MVLDEQEAVFPEILYGNFQSVKTQWRRIIKEVVATRSWNALESKTRMIPIDKLPGEIILGLGRKPQGICVHANLIWSELWNISAKTFDGPTTQDRDDWFTCIRDLTLAHSKAFWFCLGILGKGSLWLPEGTSFDAKNDRKRIASSLLEGIVLHWRTFTQIQDRFTSCIQMSWPWWCPVIVELAFDLGIDQEDIASLQCDDVVQAQKHVSKWLK